MIVINGIRTIVPSNSLTQSSSVKFYYFTAGPLWQWFPDFFLRRPLLSFFYIRTFYISTLSIIFFK